MKTMEHGILHEASDQFKFLEGGKLISMLDLMGTYKATCIKCGRWQTFATIIEEKAIEHFTATGWKMPEEICPKCATA